jgi:uroporphyrinogen decarboxylase
MTSDSSGTVAASRFVQAVAGEIQDVPPIWCMRQAGRYQDSYQALRRHHSFDALCREPDLAARVALNAVEELDFDAAILFSDLLFPLDALGLPVSYDDGGPKLARRLDDSVLDTLRDADAAMADLAFQAAAVAETRAQLPGDRGLIGFIGGPWTLFVYAMEGTHTGTLTRAKTSLPLYRRFAAHLVPLLERMARAQLSAGADLVMVFDTAAGDLSPAAFQQDVAPDLARLASALPRQLGYYARGLHPAHLEGLGASMGPWAGLGLDWRWNLAGALTAPDRRGFVQGNLDPSLLHLSGAALTRALDEFLDPLARLDPAERRGWICGLGHGVLQGTPTSSVTTFVRTVRKRLA